MQMDNTQLTNPLAVQFGAQISVGAGTATLAFREIDGTIRVSALLPQPEFTGPTNGVLTLEGVPITTITAAASYTIRDVCLVNRNADLCASMGAATSGSPDFTLSNLDIAAGETYRVDALTVSVLPGSADFT